MGFTSHIQLVPFDNNQALQGNPISVSEEFISKLLVNKK